MDTRNETRLDSTRPDTLQHAHQINVRVRELNGRMLADVDDDVVWRNCSRP